MVDNYLFWNIVEKHQFTINIRNNRGVAVKQLQVKGESTVQKVVYTILSVDTL